MCLRSSPAWRRGEHFLAASRLVPYKNVRAVVEAFRHLPDQRLIVAGSGPEAARLRAIAGPNVSFAGFVPDAELRRLMGTAKAFVFAAEEDFGIVPVEAQGEGTPVIALGRGGVRETVIAAAPLRNGAIRREDGCTGMFFDAPEPAPDRPDRSASSLARRRRAVRSRRVPTRRRFVSRPRGCSPAMPSEALGRGQARSERPCGHGHATAPVRSGRPLP